MGILGAIIAGIIATLVFAVVMVMAPRMGMPKMDIIDMPGRMFGAPSNRTMGWALHLMLGAVFGLVYAFLWSVGVGAPTWTGGLVFGIGHLLVTGLFMGMIPMMHAGMRSGQIQAPGVWMTDQGGFMAFIGGRIGHAIFGIVLALEYAAF